MNFLSFKVLRKKIYFSTKNNEHHIHTLFPHYSLVEKKNFNDFHLCSSNEI